MPDLVIELAKKAAESLLAQVGSFGAEKVLGPFEKPLIDTVPFLKHLRAVREAQIRRALTALQERVRRIELAQDGERLLEFTNMCFRYFEVGAKEHREIKLRILAAACAHCASAENRDSFDEELEFFDAVERLQPFHFMILTHLDTHHTIGDRGGEHQHPPDATFEELREAGLGIPQPHDAWLLKALMTLRDMAAIGVQGGSGLSFSDTADGYAEPVVDPMAIVKSGKICLARFGCKLLRYVEGALEYPDNTE